MSNKSSTSSSVSSIFFRVLPSITINTRSLFSQFVMTITVFVLLVAFLPCISSSPTPSSIADENNNKNKIIFNSNDYQTGSRGDSSLLSSSVQDQPSSLFYDQPRTHANQFLMSHINDNQIIVPKWFTRYNDDDDDNIDDYIPSDILINKRSSFYNAGGSQILKKRKQLTKPPMEVMNEIVNSIYLKR
jgi:hypothetical protein